MLPGSVSERTQLAMEMLQYLNLQDNLWDRGSTSIASLVAIMLHQVSDPRNQEPLSINRNTSTVAALKRNANLWLRLIPYFKPDDMRCVCGPYHEHVGGTGRCKSHKKYFDTASPKCTCKAYRLKPL